MPRISANLAIMLFCVICLSACTHHSTALNPITAPAPIPILYSNYSAPVPLTGEEINDIATQADAICPKGRKPWFIFVRYNQLESQKPTYRVIVYFSPDQQSARVRKGQCIYLDNEMTASRRKEIAARLHLDTLLSLSPYMEVSTPETPFTNDLTVPSITMLPIDQPAELDDAEIIKIVDYTYHLARHPDEYEARTSRQIELPDGKSEEIEFSVTLERIDPSDPILSIQSKGDLVEVRIGGMVGPLYGEGSLLTVRREGNGYKIVSVAIWVS